MKKLLAVSLALNVAFLAVLSWKELTAEAASGVPAGNGDVNGDGTIDVSDGVYILSWLFTGGSAPVPIERPPTAANELPATGQIRCYDTSGAEIDCGSADYPGQDGLYQAGCPIAGRFMDNGDGTVTDSCTGLMWQKETADVSDDGKIDDVDRRSWQEALKYCESLSLAGHTGWRLPNVRELQSIVDYGRYIPSIDPIFGVVSDWYWSSSTHGGSFGRAWRVNFLNGNVSDDRESGGYIFVRAVRTAR